MTETKEAFHNVAVPEGALPAVYEVISLYLSGASVPAATQTTDGWEVPNNGRWSRGDLEQLNDMLSNRAGRAIMRLIAEAGMNNETPNYGQLRAAAEAAVNGEFNFNQVRAQLSWVAKYCKRIKGENVWPMQAIDDGPETDTGEPRETGTRYRYRMPQPIAAAWLEITQGGN